MKVLITGATGFVGSHVAKRLIREGHDVWILARRESPLYRLVGVGSSKLKFCQSNGLGDLRLTEEVRDINPQIIYHFAANRASAEAESATGDISTNILGTRNLLEALKPIDYKLFVNIGSSSEYGRKNSPMKESSLLTPNSYHSFAKGAQTLLCQTAAHVDNKPIVTLRLFSVYGPFERETRLISSVVRNTIQGEPLNLSNSNTARDFVYVDDVVDACMQIDKLKELGGHILNIGTGKQSTIQEVVDNVFALLNKKVECNWDLNGRSWDTDMWVASCTKTKMFLKWKAETSLKDGLLKTIQWAQNYYG